MWRRQFANVRTSSDIGAICEYLEKLSRATVKVWSSSLVVERPANNASLLKLVILLFNKAQASNLD